MTERRREPDSHILAVWERGFFNTTRGLQDSVQESEQKENSRAGYVEGGMWSLMLHF